MTVLSFPATDINFDRNPSVLVQTMDSFSNADIPQPRVTKFEISDIADVQESVLVQSSSKTIPVSIEITYWSFAVTSLFFLFQFILTFFSASLFSGFTGLVGFVGFGGLFKVVQRIRSEVREKGFIQ